MDKLLINPTPIISNMGETFIAELDEKGRIRFTRPMLKALGLKPGELVRITAEKVKPNEAS